MTSTRSSRKERSHAQFSRMLRWELGNSRILTIFYILGVMLMMPGGTILSVLSNQNFYTDLSNWEGETVELVRSYYANAVVNDYGVMLGSGLSFLLICYALCFCGKSLSYMHTRRSVDLFHAMPIQRTPMLLGKFCALLVSMEVPLAVASVLCRVIVELYGVPVVPFFYLRCFGELFLMSAACLTFVMLFMVISGTLPGAFLSMISVTLGWPVAVFMVDHTMGLFLPGYVSVMPAVAYTLFCPAGALYQCFGTSFLGFLGFVPENVEADRLVVPQEGGIPWFFLWWILLTAVMLALAIFYYNRRKSETAENHFSFPVIRGFIRGMLSVAVGLGAGYVVGDMLDSNTAYFIAILVAAALTHVVYQFVLTHSFAEFWKTIPAYCVFMAATFGFLFLLYQGGLGYVQRIPDPAEVERVEFYIPGFAADGSKEAFLAQYADVTLYGPNETYIDSISPVLDEEEEIAVMEGLHRTVLEQKFVGPYLPFGKMEFNNELVAVSYMLKNGGTILRRYELPFLKEDTEVLGAMAEVQKLRTVQEFAVINSTEPADILEISVNQYPDEIHNYEASRGDLLDEEKQQVWETLMREMNSPKFDASAELMTTEEWLELQEHRFGEDWSGTVEAATVSEDESAEDVYFIYFGNIPFERLNDHLKEKLLKYYHAENAEFPENTEIRAVSGFGMMVPKCCEETRQLLYDLTEQNGVVYGGEGEDEWYK